MIKSELKLETYIEVLDRLLQRQGFTTIERDEIFKDPKNIELTLDSFKRRLHPSIVLKNINKEPVQLMYAEPAVDESLQNFIINEGRKKKKPKKRKLKKVFKEFGEGKLKPYHAKKNLRSKKQGGTSKEHKQAIAIALSSQRRANESYKGILDEQTINFSTGQQYAINFVKSLGLELISNPLQLKRGNFIFKDTVTQTIEWMISNTGYIRKRLVNENRSKEIKKIFGHNGLEWQVLARLKVPQYKEKSKMADDEYKEAAHILSEKVRRSRNKKEFRESYVNRAYKALIYTVNDLSTPQYGRFYVPEIKKSEIIEAIKKLYNKYVK